MQSKRTVGRGWRPFALVGLLAVAGFVAACGSSDTPSGRATGLNESNGAYIYAANCASCHGADLRGTDKGPSPLSIVYEPDHHNDDSFRSAIANGAPQHHWNFGDMAPVEGLTEEQVDEVIAYVRSEQERLGFER